MKTGGSVIETSAGSTFQTLNINSIGTVALLPVTTGKWAVIGTLNTNITATETT